MELRHLRYFLAVAEHLSFRGAAERLRVSQPALSKQIRDLEHACGARLFERNTRSVRLTDAGRLLVGEARELVARAGRLPALVRSASQGIRGSITIGNIASLTASFLPPALTAYHARHPESEVNVVEVRLRHQRAALRSGRIQVALMKEPPGPGDGDLEHALVAESALRVVVPVRHRLARRRCVALDELRTERLLAVGSEPGYDGHAETLASLFAGTGLQRPYVRSVDSVESLLALVAAGQGLTILPGMASLPKQSGVVTRELVVAGNAGRFSLWAVWRRDDSSRFVTSFIGMLQAQTSRRASRSRRARPARDVSS